MSVLRFGGTLLSGVAMTSAFWWAVEKWQAGHVHSSSSSTTAIERSPAFRRFIQFASMPASSAAGAVEAQAAALDPQQRAMSIHDFVDALTCASPCKATMTAGGGATTTSGASAMHALATAQDPHLQSVV